MQHLNIEIKAKCQNLDRIRRVLKDQQIQAKGIDHQIDTYFNVSAGRLKLRQGNIENQLIFYQRNNQAGPKRSDVSIALVEPNSPLKEVLTKALGILIEVDKQREIYFVDNVKILLDTVVGLGTFVEIEAIDDNGSHTVEQLQTQCDEYMQLFKINSTDLVSVSYSDLLLNRS